MWKKWEAMDSKLKKAVLIAVGVIVVCSIVWG
jgi:hypothetical protein